MYGWYIYLFVIYYLAKSFIAIKRILSNCSWRYQKTQVKEKEHIKSILMRSQLQIPKHCNWRPSCKQVFISYFTISLFPFETVNLYPMKASIYAGTEVIIWWLANSLACECWELIIIQLQSHSHITNLQYMVQGQFKHYEHVLIFLCYSHNNN